MVAALDVRLALRDLVGRDPRGREHLRQVGTGQVLERARVCDLVHAPAHEQVAGERPGGRVLDHLVDLQLVVPGARLEEEVVCQVLDQVPGREDVVAVPGSAVRVLRQRALAARDEVLRVADALHLRERALARVDARAAVPVGRSAGQHRVDRRRDELDVPELLRRDVREQVVERPRALAPAEVERLERVVHERRHLAELPAQELLDDGGAGGVGGRRGRKLRLELVEALDHADRVPGRTRRDAPLCRRWC